jgi:hypothetical protein
MSKERLYLFLTVFVLCYFRNHPRPGISKVLLIPNFYSHFGIDQSMIDEYDTDLMLEYDDTETYQHFR